jgi:Exopolysaccharide synthesis, ExoD
VLLLAISGIWPLPLINVLPAVTIALLAIAYLQEDGLLLAIAFAIAILSLVVFSDSWFGLGRRDRSPFQKPVPCAWAMSQNWCRMDPLSSKKQVS